MIVASTRISSILRLAASLKSGLGSSPGGIRRRKRHGLGSVPYRAPSRRIGIDSELPEVIVGPIDVRSHRVNKLEVYAQSHRDIVVVLQPMGAVDRNMNAISGSQFVRARSVL